MERDGTLIVRRVVALVLDWGIAMAISAGFFDSHPMATLGVFAAVTFVLVASLGATIGHAALGLRVTRVTDGAAPGVVAAAIRTVSLCVIVPATVWNSDGVGLHDVWAGTRISRRRSAS